MDKPRREGLRGICAGGSEALAEGNGVGMMVAERATAPESAAPCSEQNNQAESTEPDTTTCAFCGGHDVYQMDDKWICTDHIGAVVSLAANDVFSGDVHYSKEFETAVLM